MKIGILSIGYGNVAAFEDIFNDLGHNNVLQITQAEEINGLDILVLPGVGKFDMAMKELNARGLSRKIRESFTSGNLRVLGVCLGMQLLFNSSEEGTEKGLGLLKGGFKRIVTQGIGQINMGWRNVYSDEGNGIGKFYFIHSYYLSDFENCEICMKSKIEGVDFVAGINTKRLLLTQFHPEKSSHFGESLIQKWLDE